VLYFEAGAPGSNIETGGEALWWGVVTITTVGYGDFYPVTAGGQVVATIMIFSGVALIAIFTAWVASSFLSPSSSSQQTDTPTPEVENATPRMHAMEGNDPGAIIRDLRDRIDALERALLHRGKHSD
jgi:voltage-gated potassium channel